MTDEVKYHNVAIEIKPKSNLVSLDDLWTAANDCNAMQPLAWLATDVTQAYMKKFSRDLELPTKRSKYTPTCGRTTEFIIEIPTVIEVIDNRLFAAPEVAIFYLKRISSDLYKWALDELDSLKPDPKVVSPVIHEYWKKFRLGTVGPAHLDIGTTHFDMITYFPPGHGDHTDHGDNPDV
jgi:hypothetical protein